MNPSLTTHSLAQLLVFPFRDPRWVNKVLIGAGLTIISPLLLFIPSVFVGGYLLRMMRRIIVDREEPNLPEWNDWNGLFVDGCRLTGAGLIYYLPVLIIGTVGLALFILMVMFTAASKDASAAAASFSMIGTFLFEAVLMALMLVSIVISIVTAGGYAHMAAKGTFRSAFSVGEWWPIFRANLGGFLISFLLAIAVSYGLSFGLQILMFTVIFAILLPIGYGVMGYYSGVLMFALFGMAYREGLDLHAARVASIAPPVEPDFPDY